MPPSGALEFVLAGIHEGETGSGDEVVHGLRDVHLTRIEI
jgi:hypothetical protein